MGRPWRLSEFAPAPLRPPASGNGLTFSLWSTFPGLLEHHFVAVQPKTIDELHVPIVHLAVPNAAVLNKLSRASPSGSHQSQFRSWPSTVNSSPASSVTASRAQVVARAKVLERRRYRQVGRILRVRSRLPDVDQHCPRCVSAPNATWRARPNGLPGHTPQGSTRRSASIRPRHPYRPGSCALQPARVLSAQVP